MKNRPPATTPRLYSPRATLCAIGIKLRALKFFDIIVEHIHVRQKTVKHTPAEELTNAFIAILAGAHGLSEINTRVRADAALRRAARQFIVMVAPRYDCVGRLLSSRRHLSWMSSRD